MGRAEAKGTRPVRAGPRTEAGVVRTVAPKGVQVLTPTTCEPVGLHGKSDFADVVKSRIDPFFNFKMLLKRISFK